MVQDGLGSGSLDGVLFIGHIINTGLRGAYSLFGTLEWVGGWFLVGENV